MVRLLMTAILFAGMGLVIGCGDAAETKPKDKKVALKGEKKVDEKKEETKTGVGHDGWWCDEHGIKEEECSMCNSKVAKAFQDKKDWCKEHNRAKSQCFICDPKLKDKFAAEYRAKFGKEPPEPEAQKPDNDKK